MKRIFILLLASMAMNIIMAQTTETRTFSDSTGLYLVKYNYNPDGWRTVPATYPEGEPHYPATITVFEVCGEDVEQIGQPFGGTYVPGGCFEDEPGAMVSNAKKQPAPTARFSAGDGVALSDTNGVLTITATEADGSVDPDERFTIPYSSGQSLLAVPNYQTNGIRLVLAPDVITFQIPVGQWFTLDSMPGSIFKVIEKPAGKKKSRRK